LRCHLGYSLSRISFVADDGTPLTWTVFTPTTPGPWPAVLVIHGWFWIAGEETDSGPAGCARDLADAGYLAFPFPIVWRRQDRFRARSR